LASRDQASEAAALLAGVTFIMGVGLLDAMARMRIFYIDVAAQTIEALLQEADPQVFEENVLAWTFGNTRARRHWLKPPYPQFKIAYWVVRLPSFWLWHLLLILSFVAFWLVRTLSAK